MFQNKYIDRVYREIEGRNPGEKEFLQAVFEVFSSLEPVVDADPRLEGAGILERLAEPERQIVFRVPWVDDSGSVRVNRAIGCIQLCHRSLQGGTAVPSFGESFGDKISRI